MPKSTDSTVFVRFIPTPSEKVLRHQLEDVFSQIGPVKKSSWINSKDEGKKTSKGYGFVKFLAAEDAEAASKELEGTKVYMEGKSHSEVAVELDLPLGTVKSRVRLAMRKLQLMSEKLAS